MSKSTYLVMLSAVATFGHESHGALGNAPLLPDRMVRKEVKLMETNFPAVAENFCHAFGKETGLHNPSAKVELHRVDMFTQDESDNIAKMFQRVDGFTIRKIELGSLRVIEKSPMKVTRYKYTVL
jgi:hypothetical protein